MKAKRNLLVAGVLLATMRYVDVNSANPARPYTNWTATAVSIQAAADAALAGDEIVVTNGIYATGGRAVSTDVLLNRVALDKPPTLRSVTGRTTFDIRVCRVPHSPL